MAKYAKPMKTTGVSCETKFGLLGFLGHPTVYRSKICNINFGIENDPPPPGTFPKLRDSAYALYWRQAE